MIAILTDSTCDIPEDLIEAYKIFVVPHVIVWGDEQYRDRVDLQPVEFYERLEKDPERPTTAQASEGDFLAAIQKAITEQGATEAVVLTLSSAMSGAYDMALAAANEADIPVSVVDSKGPTMSLGWQVLAAARARDEGGSREEIVKAAEKVRNNVVQFVALDTLEYLQYGGRIGDAVNWVGNILKVKPLVTINHELGRVQPAGLSRTHGAVVKLLYKKFTEQVAEGGKLHIAVLHGNMLEEAQELVDKVREELDPVELLVNITGPVLGIHTGPRTLALCGYAEA
ncbi:MAG: DegV family protein [Chloroflexota bacterium]|nr:DegV family protein [Chloroflexota bacterium]